MPFDFKVSDGAFVDLGWDNGCNRPWADDDAAWDAVLSGATERRGGRTLHLETLADYALVRLSVRDFYELSAGDRPDARSPEGECVRRLRRCLDANPEDGPAVAVPNLGKRIAAWLAENAGDGEKIGADTITDAVGAPRAKVVAALGRLVKSQTAVRFGSRRSNYRWGLMTEKRRAARSDRNAKHIASLRKLIARGDRPDLLAQWNAEIVQLGGEI